MLRERRTRPDWTLRGIAGGRLAPDVADGRLNIEAKSTRSHEHQILLVAQ